MTTIPKVVINCRRKEIARDTYRCGIDQVIGEYNLEMGIIQHRPSGQARIPFGFRSIRGETFNLPNFGIDLCEWDFVR